MVPSLPFAGSHAHLRPAVARVCRSVQLQPNEVAAERRRSEEGARPSTSKTNTCVVKGRVALLLLYLMAVACVTPPLLLIRSGDVELNPGPVEAGKQLAVPVEGKSEGDVPRGMAAFCYNRVFEYLGLTFCFQD